MLIAMFSAVLSRLYSAFNKVHCHKAAIKKYLNLGCNY